jgi:hypothetical protein
LSGEDDLLISAGQLRSVIKEIHDRGADSISLPDLLDRLRVGPLARPASEYVGRILGEIDWSESGLGKRP